MEASGSTVPGKPVLAKYSCQTCSMRKVKCNKQKPCSACIKHRVVCEYRAPNTPRRKKRPDRAAILNDRLEQYEQELRRKGVDPEMLTAAGSPDPTPSTVNESAQMNADVTSMGLSDRVQLVHDRNRSKYLNNPLWTRVVAELPEPAEALGHSSEEDEDEDEATPDNIDFMLGLTPASTEISIAHPPADHIFELWNIFKQNVDPLTKIVHAPTLQALIEKTATSPSSIPKPFEALLFSIYSAAVLSLSNKNCEQCFGEPRKTLLSRYRSATKASLSRAKFLGSANLTVLQAFLIHLLTTREAYDSRTLWTMTGLALRMAEGMGLHRDGSILGLPPFETEIRRRIWWQLKLLDGDSAELSGSDKFGTFNIDPRSPKAPLNLNDDQLHPGMSSLPPAVEEASDMIFCTLRYDLRSYWSIFAAERRKQGKTDNIWQDPNPDALPELDRAISIAEASFESKYLRYCDPSDPLHLLTTLVARTAISTMRLIAHHPRRWTDAVGAPPTTSLPSSSSSASKKGAIAAPIVPETERRYVWELSIKCLTQYKMIHTTDTLKRYTWHAAFYFRWQALIHILDTLRTDPLVEEAASVWRLVEAAYETNRDFGTNTRKALYVAVGNLCLKAYAAREAALLAKDKGKPLPPTPAFITQLRAVRETVDARRRSRASAAAASIATASNTTKKLERESNDAQMLDNDGLTSQRQQKEQAPQLRGAVEERTGGFFVGFKSDENNTRADHNNNSGNGSNANVDFNDVLLGLDDPMDMTLMMNDQNTLDWVQWDTLISDFA